MIVYFVLADIMRSKKFGLKRMKSALLSIVFNRKVFAAPQWNFQGTDFRYSLLLLFFYFFPGLHQVIQRVKFFAEA